MIFKGHFKICILCVFLLTCLLTGGCQVPNHSTQPLDERLFGTWTTAASRVKATLDAEGKPTGSVPVGIWYAFSQDGRYYRIARYMTFAIGGVAVEEGSFSTEQNKIVLSHNTESFFPDEGSPQKPKYRETIADSTLIYKFSDDNDHKILSIQSGDDQPEVQYFWCQD